MTGFNRRREGGGSEQRGASMYRHVLTSAMLLLLVVLMWCTTSGGAHRDTDNGSKHTVIFTGGTSFTDTENRGLAQAFESFRAPSIVHVRGVVVAVVEAHYKNTTDSRSCVGIVAKSMKADPKTWTDGTAIVFDHYDTKIDRLVSPTAFVDGGEVTILLGGYDKSGVPLADVTAGGYWTARYAEGKVPNEQHNDKKFEWNSRSTSSIPNDVYNLQIKPEAYKQFLGGGGAGITLSNDSHVLPIQALKNDGTKVSLIIVAKGSSYGWYFSEGTSDDGCIQPAVLQWDKNRLLMMTSCEDGSRRVYESSNSGVRWVEAHDSLSRVWGNSLKREGHGVQGGFVRATISGKKVILVTQPVYSEKGQQTGQLHLWLTDMSRIYDVGPISADGKSAAASTLLYTTSKALERKLKRRTTEDPEEDDYDDGEADDEEKEAEMRGKLYCSYEVTAGDGKYDIAFVDLTEKLVGMRKVVETWKNNDAYIAKEYACADKKKAGQRGDCDCDALTKGLVGFLSNTSNGTVWKDEYLCVDATVHGKVRSTERGVTLKGPGAGVKWPVGRQGQNQPYHFANNAFTLVATVTIHEEPKKGSGPIPLMGVRIDDAAGTTGTVAFGLSYTSSKKWNITLHGETQELVGTTEWVKGKPYQLALQRKDDDWYVYVNGSKMYIGDYEGRSVGNLFQRSLKSRTVSHFYIGGDSDGRKDSDNIHVTVSSVLLYNRVLGDGELAALVKKCAAAAPEVRALGPHGASGANRVVHAPPRPAEKVIAKDQAQRAHPSSPQKQYPPAQLSGEAAKKAVAPATSPEDPGVAATRRKERMDKEAPGNTGPVSSLPTTPEAVKGPKAPETGRVVRVERSVQEHEPLPPTAAGSAMAKAGQADEGTLQSGSTDSQAQHATPIDASGSGGGVPSTPATPSGDKQHANPEEKDAQSHPARDANGDSDLPNSADMTPANGATDATEPAKGSAPAQADGIVLEGVDAAPIDPSTAPKEAGLSPVPNAGHLPDNDFVNSKNIADIVSMAINGDATVHGCASPVLLLLLLGLWGMAVL